MLNQDIAILRYTCKLNKPCSFTYFHTTPARPHIKDYYTILGVSKNASQSDIKSAYYEKAKVYHPDVNTSHEGSLLFREISEAYEILSDIEKRRDYEKLRRRRPDYDHEAFKRYSEQRSREEDILRKAAQPRKPGPISMNHINHVYRVMNQEEQLEEKPRFAPGADHRYPGSMYNRFEWDRHWDPDSKNWIFTRKSEKKIKLYHDYINKRQFWLQLGVSSLILLTALSKIL